MNKRLPTIDEWQELIDNCTWKWDGGKKGMTVTGKNGKNIFFPTEGLIHNSELINFGFEGNYWSSDIYNEPVFSLSIGFTSKYVIREESDRNNKESVRPISTIQQEGFIDLGLPSGLLWAEKNIEGLYTYDEAMKLFEDEGIEANDSELKGGSYTIPEGYEARIEDNKVILEPKESEDERIRKALVKTFEKKFERGFEWKEFGIPNRSVLDWLEKMKEPEHICDSQEFEEGYKAGIIDGRKEQKEQKPMGYSYASTTLPVLYSSRMQFKKTIDMDKELLNHNKNIMKIYVIIKSESVNFFDSFCIIGAYVNKYSAKEEFKNIVREVKTEYKREIEDGWIIEESGSSLTIFKDGRYLENHCSVWMDTTELVDIYGQRMVNTEA